MVAWDAGVVCADLAEGAFAVEDVGGGFGADGSVSAEFAALGAGLVGCGDRGGGCCSAVGDFGDGSACGSGAFAVFG